MMLTCSCGGIHSGRVEPESPMKIFIANASRLPSTPSSPFPASPHLLALQLKPSLLDGDARDRNLIGKGVLTTLQFFGPFCRSVDAQSTPQPRHTDPLTPKCYDKCDIGI